MVTHYNFSALLWIVFAIFFISSCNGEQNTRVQSPDGNLVVNFYVSDEGQPFYAVEYNNEPLIERSGLGYSFADQPDLNSDLEISGINRASHDESWETVWGEVREIRNNYNEMLVLLRESNFPNRELGIRFRAYDDGLGFRYELDASEGADSIFVTDELTEFNLTADHTTWWIPADHDSYEYLYETTPLSEIDASKYSDENNRADRHIANFKAANTPVTMRTENGTHISLHEANLTDYADMTLAVQDNFILKSELVPWSDGIAVKAGNSLESPWRTIQVGDNAGELMTSYLTLNLNEPNKLDDTSWIEPMKYTGIWWEMHIGKSSWGLGELAEDSYSSAIGGQTNHGANTDNAKSYIDFNSDAGIRGLLIEGWNTGWEYWGTDSLGFFDFTTPYPDFDIDEVVNYARQNDVAIIGHHETSGQAAPYETRLEPAFQLYNDLGIKSVKTGYAGAIVPAGEKHHGQFMVRHYRKVVETAAKYNIAINAHEPIKATGIRRTLPNMMTREGVRGMEYNAWSDGNPPEHTTILPFTRGLAGPTDYTPGIFDILFDQYRDEERVYSTLANQLALYIVIYSPMQMAADLHENYRVNGDFHPAFQFIREVAVDWDQTVVPAAEIGEFAVVARKERGGERWFVGAITDENARTLSVALEFLEEGRGYTATIYKDGEDANWETNPLSYEIEDRTVDSETVLELLLAPGGGAAIELRPRN